MAGTPDEPCGPQLPKPWKNRTWHVTATQTEFKGLTKLSSRTDLDSAQQLVEQTTAHRRVNTTTSWVLKPISPGPTSHQRPLPTAKSFPAAADLARLIDHSGASQAERNIQSNSCTFLPPLRSGHLRRLLEKFHRWHCVAESKPRYMQRAQDLLQTDGRSCKMFDLGHRCRCLGGPLLPKLRLERIKGHLEIRLQSLPAPQSTRCQVGAMTWKPSNDMYLCKVLYVACTVVHKETQAGST